MSHFIIIFKGQWADQSLRRIGHPAWSLQCYVMQASGLLDLFDPMSAEEEHLSMGIIAGMMGLPGGVAYTMGYSASNVWLASGFATPADRVPPGEDVGGGGVGSKPPGRWDNSSGGDGPFDDGEGSRGDGDAWFTRFIDFLIRCIADFRRLVQALTPAIHELGEFCGRCHKPLVEVMLLVVLVASLCGLGWQLIHAHQVGSPAPNQPAQVFSTDHTAKSEPARAVYQTRRIGNRSAHRARLIRSCRCG